jgi:hypothetical protein
MSDQLEVMVRVLPVVKKPVVSSEVQQTQGERSQQREHIQPIGLDHLEVAEAIQKQSKGYLYVKGIRS